MTTETTNTAEVTRALKARHRAMWAAGVTARRRTLRVSRFGRPEDFRDYFKANYGPTIAVYRAIADDPERTAALDAELAGLARRHDLGAGSTAGTPSNQSTVMEWEYLLLTARKRS